MRVQDVGELSLGQWAAICRTWTKAHSGRVEAPSEDDLEAALMRESG